MKSADYYLKVATESVENFILYISCMILSGVGAWIIGKTAPKLGLVDLPNERSSHAMPTPKGGGVGILAAFVLSSLVLKISASFWLPATFLALFSFFGDKIELSPKLRLSVQFIAAFSFLYTAHCLLSTPYSLFSFPLCPLSSVLCFLSLSVFIVGTANFYNFMDGIDGIAGITGVVGFGLLAFYAYLSGVDPSFATLAICMSVSCLGFLPFNMPKARVFMGDVGSVLLGFVFAGMVVWLSESFLDFVCLAAFLFPFYADELTTIVARLRDGDNLTHPHRRHLYQLLANERGISQWKISAGYGLFQLIVGISVLIVKPFGSIIVLLMVTVYFVGFVFLGFHFRRRYHEEAADK